MKKLLSIMFIYFPLLLNAQNYYITFAGSGSSTAVNFVKIDNVSAGTYVSLSGLDTLCLNVTGVTSIKEIVQLSEINLFPNPMSDYSMIEIFSMYTGNANITVYETTGKIATRIQCRLDIGRQSFRLAGLNNGFYLIVVSAEGFQIAQKLLVTGKTNGTANIEKVSDIGQSSGEKKSTTSLNKVSSIVNMQYKVGDRLKFTAISGNYKTVLTDIPDTGKTVTFNFMPCTDADNNHYAIIKIGNQVWMAENLRTTRYRNGDLIGTTTPVNWDISAENTPKYQWAYDDDQNNVAIYGRLYTWHAVTDSRNVCPSGWHVSSADETAALYNYLINNGYGYGGSGTDIAKAMASKIGWTIIFPTPSFPSNNPLTNNSSGFTAVPDGYRSADGEFRTRGDYGYGWTSTEYNTEKAWYRGILSNGSDVRMDSGSKKTGFSVRCIKD